jgi:cob(I)alamin adenosyltransferase
MSLFTGRGDDGTTKTFGAKERISKSSAIAEALGSMDEINSFLGLCKIRSKEAGLLIKGKKVCDLVHEIQKTLFTSKKKYTDHK